MLVGLGAGVLLPADNSEFEANLRSLQSSQERVEQLEADLATLESQNDALTDEARSAEAQAASARAEATTTEKRLDARRDELDEREQALDQREQALDQREQNTSIRDEPDSSASDDRGTADDAEVPQFDRAYAISVVGSIVESIEMVDERLSDGIGLASGLSILGGNYGRLLNAGIPPGEGGQYYGRLTTLQTFVLDAADLCDTNPMEAIANYQVSREQTGALFAQLNNALDTNFQLP